MTRPLASLASLLILLAVCAPSSTADEKWQETKSGLKYQVVKAGDGALAKKGDFVRVHYTGTFADGRKFDSSRGGKAFTFTVGVRGVIDGWDEALQLMNTGAQLKLHVPWKLAYGENGRRPTIPPKTDLFFEIELLEIMQSMTLVKPSGESAKALESGVKYQTLRKGSGKPPAAEQGVSLRLALYNTSEKLVFSTDDAGQAMGGQLKGLRIAGKELPFLRPLVGDMCVGDCVTVEVPGAQGFGAWTPDPRSIPANSTTYWVIELRSINDVPKFVMPSADKLKTTKSGLQYEVVSEGKGTAPTARNGVSVMYTGWTTDGTLFDSGHARGEPTSFALGRVIPGWTEGVQLMKPGAVYRFVIPAKLAYGQNGAGELIKPGATLVFLIELLSVDK